MPSITTISSETLLEQAQVFASAWSLVGGPFDSGNALEEANEAKEELALMLEEFTSNAQLKEVAEGLIAWHQHRLNNFKQVLDNAEAEEIRLGSEDQPMVLAGDKKKGFLIGLMVARSWIEEFPLSISSTDNEQE